MRAEKKKTLGAPGNGLDPGQAAALAADLAAARAEALAQLEAARATLADLETPPCPPLPDIVPGVLRDAAREARETAAQAAATQRFLAALPPGPEAEILDAAEQALADANSASADLPPAWRRTAGSLISATGMVIVIAALSLDAWVFLVPAALVVIITADLRVAASAHRAASARAAEAMAATGLDGPEDLPGAQAKAKTALAARARSEAATRRRDEAAAHWAKLASGAPPEEVETLIERLSSPVDPVVDPEAERARALAAKLVDDAERELARIEERSRQLGSFL